MNDPLQMWLIQRAKIRTPYAPKSVRLSDAVEFDYMGSAEFEFGALPASMRRFMKHLPDWSVCEVPEVQMDGRPLHVFSYYSDEKFKEYVEQIKQLQAGKLRLKERTEFSIEERKAREPVMLTPRNKKQPVYERKQADFWWDVINDVMFSFDKNHMHQLIDHMLASMDYMATSKETK